MADNDNQIIMFDSEEAARRETVTGWVSRDGFWYGENEAAARYSGCTHRACLGCGRPAGKVYLYCEACRKQRARERYAAMPRRKWEEGPLALLDGDEYFWDDDVLLDHLDEIGVAPEDAMVVLCKPCDPPVLVATDFLSDVLPEDWDAPQAVVEAANAFNAAVKAAMPLSWWPDNVAAIWR